MLSARIKAIFIGLLLLFFYLYIKSPSVYASDSYYQNTNSNVPFTSHYRAQVALIDATSAIICQVLGFDIVNPNQPCLGIDPATNKIGFVEADKEVPLKNAIGGLAGLITMTFDIPVNTTDYVRFLSSGFSIIKPAHAQTTGFNNLGALLTLWRKVRDLTYLGFVLMFVLIGLGTMLRIKLDPRTVMSIQNQIPKAVTYIILITFSYAIAGLLIDGMWVTTFTGVNLITDGITCTDGASLTQKGTTYLLDNPIHYVNRTLGCPFDAGGEEVNRGTIFRLGQVIGNTLGEIVSTTILSVFGNFTSIRCAWTDPDTYGNCIKLGFQEVLSWIIGFIMMLAIIVAVFVQLIRVWVNLLKAYMQILLYTILAPIWIIAGIFPNNTNFGFTVWVRKMLASLAVYPITIFLFLVAVVLASDARIQNPNPTAGEVFLPPMVGNPSIADNMGFLLALGIILITPEVVNMTREMFKTSPSKYAPAAMAALGAGMGSAMSPMKKGWGALNARDQAGGAKGLFAHVQDRFTGNITRGAARRWDFTAQAWNKRFGNSFADPIMQTSKGFDVTGTVRKDEHGNEYVVNSRNRQRRSGAPSTQGAGSAPESPAPTPSLDAIPPVPDPANPPPAAQADANPAAATPPAAQPDAGDATAPKPDDTNTPPTT